MSTQGIISILLTVVGFLFMAWIGVVWMYVMEKFGKLDKNIDLHDERIQVLEINRIEEQVDREEILDILRGLKSVG